MRNLKEYVYTSRWCDLEEIIKPRVNETIWDQGSDMLTDFILVINARSMIGLKCFGNRRYE